MSWIQKLCEVYDVMSGEESCDLVPIGFTEKKIKYNVILSADGEFVTAQQFPKESQLCIVPTTSAAEGRTALRSRSPNSSSIWCARRDRIIPGLQTT